ncbi:hypothetical protein T484DRAFT_1757358, partial [Baffinella frigidus]
MPPSPAAPARAAPQASARGNTPAIPNPASASPTRSPAASFTPAPPARARTPPTPARAPAPPPAAPAAPAAAPALLSAAPARAPALAAAPSVVAAAAATAAAAGMAGGGGGLGSPTDQSPGAQSNGSSRPAAP